MPSGDPDQNPLWGNEPTWYSSYLNRLPNARQTANRIYGNAAGVAGSAYGAALGFTTKGETKIPFGKNTGWLFGLIGGIVIAALLIPMQFSDLVRYGKAQKCSGSSSGSDDDSPMKMSTATILGFVTLGTAGLLIGMSFWILFHFDGIGGNVADSDEWRPITAPALVFVMAFFALALTYGIMYAIQKPIGDGDDGSGKKKKDKGGDDGGEGGDGGGGSDGKFENWHAGFGGATAGTAGILGLVMAAAFFKLKKGDSPSSIPPPSAAVNMQGAAAMLPSYISAGPQQ